MLYHFKLHQSSRRTLALAVILVLSAIPAYSEPPQSAIGVAAGGRSQKLQQAIKPYLIGKDGTSGWRFTTAPNLIRGAEGNFKMQADKLSYVVSSALAIEFPAIEVAIVPEGTDFAVTLTLSGNPQLRSADSVVATVTPGEYKISGRWNPVREAFHSLDVRFSGLLVALANGMSVSVDQLSGKFSTAAAASENANYTSQMDGSLSVEGLHARTLDEQVRASVENAKLEFGMTGIDKDTVLKLDFSHTLPPDRYRGVISEVMPMQLSFASAATPFAWQSLLREIAPTLAAVADKEVTTPSQVWPLVWRRLSSVLSNGNSDFAVNQFSGQSAGLNASGKGLVHFRNGQEPEGRLNFYIRGINERIAVLTPQRRSDFPLLYPSLALMSAVGKMAKENGQRLHRYTVNLGSSGINVNGHDVMTLKPVP